MEASEQQLFTEEGAVRALADRVVIEHLEIADERAARVIRERAEAGEAPAQTVADAIEIGTRVLDREDLATEVDYVRAELERHGAALGERLSRQLEAGEDALTERLASAFGEDRDGSVQNQIREIVRHLGEEQREALVRQLMSDDGLLSDLKAALVREVGESKRETVALRNKVEELNKAIALGEERDEADRRVAEAEEAGTRKGISFEDRVHEAIERIAAARGDVAHHVGGEQAEGGGKKGDTLVELGAAEGPVAGRVLFEAKDKKQISKNDAWKYLNEGMSRRAAAFAVLVVAGEERIPSGRRMLTEYEGNKMIVAVDRDVPDELSLEVAYKLAAARVLMEREGELEVDAVAVLAAAEEAVSILKQAQSIRSALTGIKTSSDKARDNLDAMVEAVRAKLERIDALVADAGEAPDSP
jgi:hypothetical protein